MFKSLIKACDNIFGVNAQLNLLSSEGYTILKDFMFYSHDGKKLHIDYLILSQYGFFIINFIGLNGAVSGDENDENWIQKSKDNEITFHNPILDMNEIINELRDFIRKEFNKLFFIPIIVVNKMRQNFFCSSVHFTLFKDLIPYIKGYRYICNISKQDIQDIINKVRI